MYKYKLLHNIIED